MHEYSLDISIREKMYFYISMLTIILMFIFSYLFSSFYWFKFVAPTATLVYGFLVWLFNKSLWRLSWINILIGIPDLNGIWEGTLSREGEENPRQITLKISQSVVKIGIVMIGNSSTSESISADLSVENKENIFLRYIYYSEPTFGEATTNKYGEGCTKLWLSEENGIKKLSGRYFSAKLVKGTLLLSKKT